MLFFARLHRKVFQSQPAISCQVLSCNVYLLYGRQSVILLVHLSSLILATCPAHLHFCSLTTCVISFKRFFSLIHVDLFFLIVTAIIALSMPLCAIMRNLSVCLVSFPVNQQYYTYTSLTLI